MKIETGGPAFPSAVPHIAQNNTTGETTQFQYLSDGITLRDYFAAKAMTIHLSQQARPWEGYNYRNAATQAYQMADAMLAARKQESSNEHD